MSKVYNCLSFIKEYNENGTIDTDQINQIKESLEQLQCPEEYNFNFFLIKLISETSDSDILNAVYTTLDNTFDSEKQIKLKSFNPRSLANNECFVILLNLLTLPADNHKLSYLSYLLIDQIFQQMPTRDFISIELYDKIFSFILSNPDRSSKLFSSIILEVNQIDTKYQPIIFEVLSKYMSNKNPIANPNIYAGLFGLSKLLTSEISVPEELLQTCFDIFIESADEHIISFILFIMIKLEEAPHFAFNKVLEIIDQYHSDISYIAIKFMTKFCTQWTDPQKEMLVDHLLEVFPNLYFKSSNLAMYIILKLMKKLPSDSSFFTILINGIENCDYKPLSIACAQIIIRDWALEGLNEERLKLIDDFQTVMERMLLVEEEEIASICQKALDSLNVYLKAEETE